MTPYVHNLRDIYVEAVKDTGIYVDFKSVFLRAVNEDRVVIDQHPTGLITGFLLWQQEIEPETGRVHWFERMLYVRKSYRGLSLGEGLVSTWEALASKQEHPVILHAGASLQKTEISRRLYEGLGFRTSYSFIKEVA